MLERNKRKNETFWKQVRGERSSQELLSWSDEARRNHFEAQVDNRR